jgi:hypothetical protein
MSSAKERAAAKAAKDSKKVLPGWWKTSLYGSALWTAATGWLYSSGGFKSKFYGCTVEISTLDSFMATSIIVSGLVLLVSLFGGLYHLEN